MQGQKQIDTKALPVLSAMSFDGDIARLEGQLDRPTYNLVNKVLEGLGGKWNKKLKGHVFDGCPQEIVGDAIVSGSYVDEKQAFQFYETPDALADAMLAPIDLNLEMRVLEPSAGRGALLRALCRRGGDAQMFLTDAVEINPKHRAELETFGCAVHVLDFLSIDPVSSEWEIGGYDLIVMNPPFTRSQDIAHVRHAHSFLKYNGQLVAIMGSGWTFRSDRKAVEFREWLESAGGTYEANPPDSFKESGTAVNTVLVRIEKRSS